MNQKIKKNISRKNNKKYKLSKIKKNKNRIKKGGLINNLEYLRQKNPDIFIPQNQINEIYQIMFDIHNFLLKYDIPYFAFGGTLIGAVRNKGLIYWDDDLDICTTNKHIEKIKSLEKILNLNGFSISNFWGGIKIYYTDNKMIKNLGWSHIKESYFDWSWPFVDIFGCEIVNDKVLINNHNNKPNCFFYKNDLFPLKLYKFGNIQIYGPRNSLNFLNKCFGSDWNTKAKINSYNHRKEWFNNINLKEIDIDNSLLTCPLNSKKLVKKF